MTVAADLLPSLLGHTYSELEQRLAADGVRPAHAAELWRALHQGPLAPALDEHEVFLPPLRRWLGSHLEVDLTARLPERSRVVPSEDGLTHKLLLRLADGQEIETVVMGYPGRYTACLSTQAGCALGCVFCATGQMGFSRHLRAGEIVAQVAVARRFLHERGLKGPRNLVLMGMGEPLHNYENVMQALDILRDDRGHGIGPARVSVSTVGLVPAIRRFTEERRPYNLAVSLHAADDEERSRLLPVNRRWPLAELIAACREYSERSGRKIFFGWTLIAGRNDTPEQARKVAGLLKDLHAHVNLIPLNPTGGFDGDGPAEDAARAFQRILREAGLPSTLRQRRGIDVSAGCGQLSARNERVSRGRPQS